MNKYVLGIDTMRCEMCEMHVEDAIRKAIKVKKINASHITNKVVVILEDNLSLDDFHKILDSTGYKITSFEVSEAKRTILGWK